MRVPGTIHLVCLLAVAAALRLCVVALFDHVPASDELAYLAMVSNVLEGNGLVDIHGNRALYNAGYPLALIPVLALTGVELSAIQLFNVALGTLSVLLVYLVTTTIYDQKWTAFAAAALWAVFLPHIVQTLYVGRENLVIPLLLVQLLLTLRYPSAERKVPLLIALGLVSALQALAGSSAMALVPAISLYIVLSSKNLWSGCGWLMLVGVAGVAGLTPWLLRNYHIFGELVFSTTGGLNLYLGNNPNTTGPFYMSIADTPIGPQWAELRTTMGENELHKHLTALAREHMASDPLRSLRLGLHKFVAFWAPPFHQGEATTPSTAELAGRVIWLVQYLLLAALGLYGVVSKLARGRREIWFLLACLVFYTALHTLFIVVFRYRMAVMPIVCILAAIGVVALLEHVRARFATEGS